MKPILHIHDDVLPLGEAKQVRAELLASPFDPWIGPDGGQYDHTSQAVSFEKHLGPAIQRILGAKPVFKIAGWRVDFAGEASVNWCHADKICGTEWAAVYYLTPDEIARGGTAFWGHRKTGLEFLPTDEVLKSAGFELGRFHRWMTDETRDPEAWELKGAASMRFNRLILYPTAQWHSRTPAEGFGDSPENGRLVGVGFFDLEAVPEPTWPSEPGLELASPIPKGARWIEKSATHQGFWVTLDGQCLTKSGTRIGFDGPDAGDTKWEIPPGPEGPCGLSSAARWVAPMGDTPGFWVESDGRLLDERGYPLGFAVLGDSVAVGPAGDAGVFVKDEWPDVIGVSTVGLLGPGQA